MLKNHDIFYFKKYENQQHEKSFSVMYKDIFIIM